MAAPSSPPPPSPVEGPRRPGRGGALAEVLRSEAVGGVLLLAASGVALAWANSPWRAGYTAFTGARFGPGALDLRLSVAHWAADGLLAVFFFVVGLELKREFVVGDLRSPRAAALPILAAVCGMAGPAGVYLLVNSAHRTGTSDGWAVPMATDIAFAVAALAVLGSHLPTALRSFLLTLAVVDDLLSVAVIAVFFTDRVHVLPLLGAFAAIAVFATLVRRRVTHWWLLAPLALAAWALTHASGVHSTIAGVLLGFSVPARAGPGERISLSERFAHRWRPVSAGAAVPLFALASAGVTLSGGVGATLADPAGLGVALGLLLGKPAGVFCGSLLLTRATPLRLGGGLSWWDVLGVSLLAGMGFTVALLVGQLSFPPGSPRENHVKTAILLGSLASAALAAVVLRARDRHYRGLDGRRPAGGLLPGPRSDGDAARDRL